MQVTRVFIGPSMNVAMSTKAFANGVILITVVLHIANQIQEVFERSDFQTSLAFLEYRRFEARRAVVCSLSAYKEPKLPGTSSAGPTLYPSIPDAKYRLRKHGCVQKGKFRYFGLKSRGIFTFLFPSSPPFSLFLFSFLVLGIYWASFPREKFWGTQDLRVQKEELQVGSGGFSSPFSAQRYVFFCLFIRLP